MLTLFHVETGSVVAQKILADWQKEKMRISLVMPRDYARVLAAMERAQREGLDVDKVVMEAI